MDRIGRDRQAVARRWGDLDISGVCSRSAWLAGQLRGAQSAVTKARRTSPTSSGPASSPPCWPPASRERREPPLARPARGRDPRASGRRRHGDVPRRAPHRRRGAGGRAGPQPRDDLPLVRLTRRPRRRGALGRRLEGRRQRATLDAQARRRRAAAVFDAINRNLAEAASLRRFVQDERAVAMRIVTSSAGDVPAADRAADHRDDRGRDRGGPLRPAGSTPGRSATRSCAGRGVPLQRRDARHPWGCRAPARRRSGVARSYSEMTT